MSKKPKDERVRVLRILDAARTARRFMEGKGRSDLDTDEMLGLAMVRLLEIIGEASKNVPQDIKDQTPQLPWPLIARMRDRIAHGYFDINMDRVWEVVTGDLPPLISVLDGLHITIPAPGDSDTQP